MPRVLHVLASNERRGAEVFAVTLADALEPLGCDSTVVSLRSSPSTVRVTATPLGERIGLQTLGRLRRFSRAHDVVVAHGSITLPACALACAGTAPFVYRSIGDPAYWSAGAMKRRQTTWLLNQAHTVVTLFPAAADVLRQRGVRTEVVTIPNAVSAHGFPVVTAPLRRGARLQLGIPDHATVVLYLGALSPEKRPERAIALGEARSDWTVLIVGDGTLRASLEARARRTPNVTLHGPTAVPHRFLQAADVVVVPSDTEGIPAVALEAGLSGLPVVASDVGGVSSIIEHRTTGLLVPPGDDEALARAVQCALGDREAIGQAARERCLERFTTERVAGQWAELINVVARPGTGT